jgi:DNA polymerase III epsilon subunit-like protein
LRNELLNRELCYDNKAFNIKTLWEVRADSQWGSKIDPDDISPSDRMEWKPVKKLMSLASELYCYALNKVDAQNTINAKEFLDSKKFWHPKCVKTLLMCIERPVQTELLVLAKYLLILNAYYKCFADNTGAIKDKIIILKAIDNYFIEWKIQPSANCVTIDQIKCIKESIASLEALAKLYEEIYKTPLQLTSILGTNIVENFFSTIRHKESVPNFYQYTYTYYRAWTELIKKFAFDCPFPLPKVQLSKSYNNQQGLCFAMKDVELVSPTERSKACAILLQHNKGTESDKVKSKELASVYACTTRKLTIREATCKLHPLRGSQQDPIFCEFSGCKRPYRYAGALRTHYIRVHNLALSDVEKRLEGLNVSEELFSMEMEEKDFIDEVFAAEIAFANQPQINKYPNTVVLFDLETTGWHSKAQIVEIFAYDMRSLKTFHALVYPVHRTEEGWIPSAIQDGARRAHGYTLEMLKQQGRSWSVIGKQFMEWLSRLANEIGLISHNISFDRRVLQYDCGVHNISEHPNIKFGCSLKLAQELLQEVTAHHSIEKLMEFYKISPNGALHTAKVDH